jgi:hypothetical protein
LVSFSCPWTGKEGSGEILEEYGCSIMGPLVRPLQPELIASHEASKGGVKGEQLCEGQVGLLDGNLGFVSTCKNHTYYRKEN